LSNERYDRQIRIWGTRGQEIIEKTSILLVGVGGTGSEILKNLVLLGFGEIHIIDLDKIELSNLNRQFFFYNDDIGKYKAEVSAEKSQKLNPKVRLFVYNKRIQDVKIEILDSCDYFISALDNLSARLYLNQKAIELNKPLFDCGTEGFFGHVQVVIPHKTPCLVCYNLWVHPEMNFKCTYAINPRTPLDCALEARDQFYILNNRLPDPNNDNDIQDLLDIAKKHAEKFNIIGINTHTIKDSLKGTVESIITINSIIGSVLVNELIKLVISKLDIFKELELKIITFFQFQGKTESGWTVPLEKNDDCPICGINQIEILEDGNTPLIQFVEKINYKLNNLFKLPLLIHNGIIIYREQINLINKSESNESEINRLKKLENTPINEIFKSLDLIFIKDEATGVKINVRIKF